VERARSHAASLHVTHAVIAGEASTVLQAQSRRTQLLTEAREASPKCSRAPPPSI
jgi:hypothetical protein